jgi:hypothetical protein
MIRSTFSPNVICLPETSVAAILLDREPGRDPGAVLWISASIGPLFPSDLTLGLLLGALYGDPLLSSSISVG